MTKHTTRLSHINIDSLSLSLGRIILAPHHPQTIRSNQVRICEQSRERGRHTINENCVQPQKTTNNKWNLCGLVGVLWGREREKAKKKKQINFSLSIDVNNWGERDSHSNCCIISSKCSFNASTHTRALSLALMNTKILCRTWVCLEFSILLYRFVCHICFD